MTPAPRIKRTRQAISTLCRDVPDAGNACLKATLRRYPLHILELLAGAGVAIRILKDDERYNDASAHLRERKINVDGWPVPPAGLFVRAERTLYLRQTNPMVISHELNHAVDYALGKRGIP